LEYRHPDGRFASSAVIEASALISARMTAAVYGLNDRLTFASGHEIDAESARQVPESMIGRLLDDRDLRRLQQALMPKKPPAPSVQRRSAGRAAYRERCVSRTRAEPDWQDQLVDDALRLVEEMDADHLEKFLSAFRRTYELRRQNSKQSRRRVGKR